MNLNQIKLIIILIFCTTALYGNKLTFGIFPYFDAASLAKLHKPLNDHLSNSTNTKIRLVSAPNFKTFKERTANARYDIIITAPHLGRVAQNVADYEWLGFTSNISYAVFVSHIDSNINSINDLKGKSIALPPKGAIIHYLALDTLKKHNIIPNKNINLLIHKSHNNAMFSTILKNTDASSFGAPTWKKYKSPDKKNLKMIGKSEDIPGFAIMVHSKTPEKLKKALKKALFSFSNTTEGKEYFHTTGLKGIRETTRNDMKLLDKYLNLMDSKK